MADTDVTPVCLGTKDPISVVDQITMPSSIPHDFPQLLQCPFRARIRCHIDMRQPPRTVLDHHEHIQHPERRRDRNEEIARKNRHCVVLQESGPALITARMTPWPHRHVFADRPWRSAYTELHQQLIGDPLLAP